MNPRSVFFILALVFLVVFFGVGCLLAFIIPSSMTKKKKRCTDSTLAVVTDISIYRGSKTGASYAPVYEYSFGGNLYKRTPHAHTQRKPQIGNQVKLLINPNNPEEFYDDESGKYVQKVLKIIGYPFMTVGIIGAVGFAVAAVLH